MSYIKTQKIPSSQEVLDAIALPSNLVKIKAKRDEELKKIITGELDKFIVIVGPCSASDEDAVFDYVSRLGKLNEKVSDKLFLIPRVYTNKPRTTGEGYKGMLHQPDPNKATDIYAGIRKIREMHIKVIGESHLTAADEMLYPENLVFVNDMLSYVAIGARSVENQQHRLVSSMIDVPVGMKNPTSGDISVMLNSIQAAQSKHEFLYRSHEVHTSGNPLAHAILRGLVDQYGQSLPNYHYEDLIRLASDYDKRKLLNHAVICDANHANSNKKHYEQPRIVEEILNNRKANSDIRTLVKGVMIESFIVEGSQDISEGVYGKSITDACLGWEDTEKLLYKLAENA
ncbi:MAG: 3-deoxy-7-phosphoheptulonate synthase [Clostridia bacterium]